MKKIYGLYNDDEVVSLAAKQAVDSGLKVSDVYSPFPIHGIEKIVGIAWTRLAICAFIFGLSGLIIGISFMWWVMGIDWPMIIGGKPNFSLIEGLPAYIPIAFEFTVLCAAHGMAITYFIRNWTFPGAVARNPDPRTTDDCFAMEIDPIYNQNFTKNQIIDLFKTTGAFEIFEKNLGEEPTHLNLNNFSSSNVQPANVIIPAITEPTVKDALVKIEGIGPKIQELLYGAGIFTFKQLSESKSSDILVILTAAGPRYRVHDPASWPQQAALAFENKWDELNKWQDEHKGGKL